MNGKKNLFCQQHNKPIEGYCQNCEEYVCASCLFTSGNPHKTHNLISLEELANYLRVLIDQNGPIFKHDYTEKHKIELKQLQKSLTTQKDNLIKKIEDNVEKLINVINERKENIIEEINNFTNVEIEKITQQENKWNQKGEIAKKILKIQIDFDDENVYSNMEFILKGIRFLKEPIQQYEYKSLTDVRENILIDKAKSLYISIEELNDIVGEMYSISEEDIVDIPYKS